jgi:hypothetical protein
MVWPQDCTSDKNHQFILIFTSLIHHDPTTGAPPEAVLLRPDQKTFAF